MVEKRRVPHALSHQRCRARGHPASAACTTVVGPDARQIYYKQGFEIAASLAPIRGRGHEKMKDEEQSAGDPHMQRHETLSGLHQAGMATREALFQATRWSSCVQLGMMCCAEVDDTLTRYGPVMWRAEIRAQTAAKRCR
jgi:hypothetical protein